MAAVKTLYAFEYFIEMRGVGFGGHSHLSYGHIGHVGSLENVRLNLTLRIEQRFPTF